MLRSLCMCPTEKAVLYFMDVRLESLGSLSRLEWQSKSFKEELATLYMVRFLIALQITESFFFKVASLTCHITSWRVLNLSTRAREKLRYFSGDRHHQTAILHQENPLRASVIASKCILMSSWLWSQIIVRSLYRSRYPLLAVQGKFLHCHLLWSWWFIWGGDWKGLYCTRIINPVLR